MSKENAFAYLKTLLEVPEKAPSAQSVDAFIALAAKNGYEFTAEEFREMVRALSSGNRALSEEELEAVAGGARFHDINAVVPNGLLRDLGDFGRLSLSSSMAPATPMKPTS